MNDNQLKSINGILNKASLITELKALQDNGIISFCSKDYRNGYDGYDKKQFFAPFYIEFNNGEGWLLFASNSIRNDRMNNQQWSSLHLKKLSSNITRSYLVIPDEISQNDREKAIASNYQKKITSTMYSTIEDVCYQTEMINMIADYSHQLATATPHKSVILDISANEAIAAEPNFESLIIGCYKSVEHLKWILSNKMYNVRLKGRRGAITQTYLVNKASKLLLYNQSNHKMYRYFHLSNTIERADSKRMNELDYPNCQSGREYLLYHITKELSAPFVDVDILIEQYKPAKWAMCAPIFVSYNGDIEDLDQLD